MGKFMFKRLCLIGLGLIGSSLARAVKDAHRLAETVVACDKSGHVRSRVEALGIADEVYASPAEAVRGADLIIICVPVGAYAGVAEAIQHDLTPGAIISDVGSVKQSIINQVSPFLPEGVHLIPGHPVAGTEHSGPDAGFADLFQNRWCIVTPLPGADETAVAKVQGFWERIGSKVEMMDPQHHDMVLAITSHLPHLIAYTIVGTATDLAGSLQQEVIKYSAGGFRDFTRIAASDPIMWRDVFLNNKEAVLEMLQRFNEDLTALQRAIRWGDGQKLEELFTRTRAVRRGIIEAKQA